MLPGCLLGKTRKPGRFCNLSPRALADLDGLITHVMWPMNNIMKMPYEVALQAIEQNQSATFKRSACDAGHIQISVIVRSLPEIEQNAQGHKEIFRTRSLRNPRIGALG
jgi:hypothetical protein